MPGMIIEPEAAHSPRNAAVMAVDVLSAWPPAQADNVGILATEVYFPSTYVRQEDLEKHDGVPAGKYTIGLGQQGLSFCGDREDSVSMCMTVFRRLLVNHNIDPRAIGHVQCGTETSVDGSKGLKTYIMPLLEESGNTDVEGVDLVQACYGGTAAVLNAAAWVESRAWDGRYAVVLCSDIALYAPGPARATSGAGAVALLIGPDAPLALERGVQATHMQHAYDFYKPGGPYPAVDGPLSVYCSLHTWDICWARYADKFERKLGHTCRLSEVDHVIFHAPYNKLVQKAYARLWYLDGCRNEQLAAQLDGAAALQQAAGVPSIKKEGVATVAAQSGSTAPAPNRTASGHPYPPTNMPPGLEKYLMSTAFASYDAKVRPSTCVQRQCGNMYAASVWSGIAQLIETTGPDLEGRRVLLYSYGSGISATMLSLRGRQPSSEAHAAKFSLGHIQARSALAMRLARRPPCSVTDFLAAAARSESLYSTGRAISYATSWPPVRDLAPGTYYLTNVDERFHRNYALHE